MPSNHLSVATQSSPIFKRPTDLSTLPDVQPRSSITIYWPQSAIVAFPTVVSSDFFEPLGDRPAISTSWLCYGLYLAALSAEYHTLFIDGVGAELVSRFAYLIDRVKPLAPGSSLIRVFKIHYVSYLAFQSTVCI